MRNYHTPQPPFPGPNAHLSELVRELAPGGQRRLSHPRDCRAAPVTLGAFAAAVVRQVPYNNTGLCVNSQPFPL